MRTLTVKNVPPEVAEALERERLRQGKSLNQTVIELFAQGLGVGTTPSNGLGRLAGGWTEEEFQELQRAVAPFGEIGAT
jgi:hypothetical protein